MGEALEAARGYRWPAGEHRGQILADLPTPFLQWAQKNSWHEDVRAMCTAVLRLREREAQGRQLLAKLSGGAIDELLAVVLGLHERIDRLEAALEQLGFDPDASGPAEGR